MRDGRHREEKKEEEREEKKERKEEEREESRLRSRPSLIETIVLFSFLSHSLPITAQKEMRKASLPFSPRHPQGERNTRSLSVLLSTLRR